MSALFFVCDASRAPPTHQRLLATPGDLRETTEVRCLIGVEGAPWECVWTGRTPDGRFEVDHASPYSVWGANDRRNLLPCLARVHRAARRHCAVLGALREPVGDAVHPADARVVGQHSRAARVGETGLTGLEETVERLATTGGLARWEP